MIFVTHDLAVAAEIADDVAVMYAGPLCRDRSRFSEIIRNPKHPYTRGLLEANVQPGRGSARWRFPARRRTWRRLPQDAASPRAASSRPNRCWERLPICTRFGVPRGPLHPAGAGATGSLTPSGAGRSRADKHHTC